MQTLALPCPRPPGKAHSHASICLCLISIILTVVRMDVYSTAIERIATAALLPQETVRQLCNEFVLAGSAAVFGVHELLQNWIADHGSHVHWRWADTECVDLQSLWEQSQCSATAVPGCTGNSPSASLPADLDFFVLNKDIASLPSTLHAFATSMEHLPQAGWNESNQNKMCISGEGAIVTFLRKPSPLQFVSCESDTPEQIISAFDLSVTQACLHKGRVLCSKRLLLSFLTGIAWPNQQMSLRWHRMIRYHQRGWRMWCDPDNVFMPWFGYAQEFVNPERKVFTDITEETLQSAGCKPVSRESVLELYENEEVCDAAMRRLAMGVQQFADHVATDDTTAVPLYHELCHTQHQFTEQDVVACRFTVGLNQSYLEHESGHYYARVASPDNYVVPEAMEAVYTVSLLFHIPHRDWSIPLLQMLHHGGGFPTWKLTVNVDIQHGSGESMSLRLPQGEVVRVQITEQHEDFMRLMEVLSKRVSTCPFDNNALWLHLNGFNNGQHLHQGHSYAVEVIPRIVVNSNVCFVVLVLAHDFSVVHEAAASQSIRTPYNYLHQLCSVEFPNLYEELTQAYHSHPLSQAKQAFEQLHHGDRKRADDQFTFEARLLCDHMTTDSGWIQHDVKRDMLSKAVQHIEAIVKTHGLDILFQKFKTLIHPFGTGREVQNVCSDGHTLVETDKHYAKQCNRLSQFIQFIHDASQLDWVSIRQDLLQDSSGEIMVSAASAASTTEANTPASAALKLIKDEFGDIPDFSKVLMAENHEHGCQTCGVKEQVRVLQPCKHISCLQCSPTSYPCSLCAGDVQYEISPTMFQAALQACMKQFPRHIQPDCPICLGPVSRCVMCLPCGHTFCARCLERWKHHSTCPCCRTYITDTKPYASCWARCLHREILTVVHHRIQPAFDWCLRLVRYLYQMRLDLIREVELRESQSAGMADRMKHSCEVASTMCKDSRFTIWLYAYGFHPFDALCNGGGGGPLFFF